MLHEEANRQLLESLDAASKRAQAAMIPGKADIVAIVLGLRGLVVNLLIEVRSLRAELADLQSRIGPKENSNAASCDRRITEGEAA